MGGFKATPEDFEREMIIRRLEERFGRRIKELEQRVDALDQQQEPAKEARPVDKPVHLCPNCHQPMWETTEGGWWCPVCKMSITPEQHAQPEQPEPCPVCLHAFIPRGQGEFEHPWEDCFFSGVTVTNEDILAWNALCRDVQRGRLYPSLETEYQRAAAQATEYACQAKELRQERDELAGIVRNIVAQFEKQPLHAKRTMDGGVSNAVNAAREWVEAQGGGND